MNSNPTTTIDQHSNLQNQKTEMNSPLMVKPKKSLLDEIQKLKTLVTTARYNHEDLNDVNDLKILKDRFLITDKKCYVEPMNCIDVLTNESFLCKVVNEPHDKVALAYFRLQHNEDDNEGHHLVRPVYDIIPQSTNYTYLIINPLRHNYQHNDENLHSYIRNHKRLEETEARSIFRQICKTVQLCHQNGIILRDIKLRKFLFIDQERTKLQYESLEGAVILDDSNDDTLTDKIGCPLYVSPELITANSTYGGQAADMWALGVMLYTILVGQYPFSDGQGQTIFAKISNCEFYLPNGLSSKARCLIRSLLRRNPDERLKSNDILFHPWFNETDNESDISGLDRRIDQCVPEYIGYDRDMT